MGIVNGLGIRSFSSVKVKVLLRELHGDHHPRFSLRAQGVNTAIFIRQMWIGLIMSLTDFGSGLIRPRAQTCLGSNMVRADFGSGLIRPRAQTCCASPTRTPARLANSPGFKSFRCPRRRIKFSLERFQIRRESVCVPSRWEVLSGEFRRRPTALVIKFQKPDRVGRRGLSEPREDFSRLLT